MCYKPYEGHKDFLNRGVSIIKKEWFEPKIIEISTKLTETGEWKTHGTGDEYAQDQLSDWQDCCCS